LAAHSAAEDAELSAPRSSGTITLSDTLRQRCLTVLREGLRCDEFWPAMHAAEALTLAGRGDEVREFLPDKLQAEEDAQRRCGLARELVRAGDRSQTAVLLEVLADDDPYGHTHAAESLFKVGEVGDGRLLGAAMRREENPKLQIMAAAALARSGNRAAMSLVREHVQRPDAEVSRTAAWVLTQIGDASDVPALRAGWERFEDPLTRCYFSNALAVLGDEEGRKSLRANLVHSDPAVRTYAANFAGDARAVETVEVLTRLLDDPATDVRIRAAQSLLTLAQAPPPDSAKSR
jgi:sialidase-1